MNQFTEDITRFLAEAVSSEFQAELHEKDAERLLEVPPNHKMGDYAFPCFTLAKLLQRPPKVIAETLAHRFSATECISRIVVAGPYLNFFVARTRFIEAILGRVAEEGDGFGKSTDGAGRTVVIDYSSPNIAKHLAVHHMRSALIGNAIYRLHSACGFRCIGINHLGDWGTQFGKLIVAYKRWGDVLKGAAISINTLYEMYVRFHREAEDNPALEDEARERFKQLESGDEDATKIWQLFKEISMKEFDKIYKMLGISFDYYTGESFYNEMLDDTVRRIEEAGLLELSDKAQVVNLDKYDMPPCLIRKADDASLYATRDICAAEYRKKKFDFHKMVYVVGSEQKLHFRQFKQVLGLMGYDWVETCHHVDFGLVKFKEAKMSTRKGTVILLEDLLNESVLRANTIIERKNPDLENRSEVAEAVGIGAIIFSDLKNRRIKDVNFSWDDILNFDGETGPYVQYTHARLCSIKRKYCKEHGLRPADLDKEIANANISLLNNDEDFLLVKKLEQFPSAIGRAADAFEPSTLVNHLLEVCSALNRYYNQHRIISADESLTAARLALIDSVRQVIVNGLSLIGMKAPERM